LAFHLYRLLIMPTTRRTSGRTSGGATGKQSTLSFPHRVTKSVPKSAKDAVASAPVKKSPLSKSTDVEPTDEPEKAAIQPAMVERVGPVEETKPSPPVKSESEVRAEKVSNAAIEKYWRTQEAARMAKRVHQQDLSTGEKVLRYFDVSSQYGVSATLIRNLAVPRSETNYTPCIAVHWHHKDEEMVQGRATRVESSNRGSGRAR
jgi:DNA polymerase delta subunit 4